MNKLNAILDFLGLMTIGHHTTLLTQEKKEQAARRSQEQRTVEREHGTALAEAKAVAYQHGFEAGRAYEADAQAATLAAERAHQAQLQRQAEEARKNWLVSAMPLGFTPRISREFKTEVTARFPHPPTADQWKMILANDPATYVIAGAGSGKSTSLVLRVIALNLYLGIDRNQLSVFTFTKASRFDFIEKLQASLSKWQIELSEQEAKRIVRTFHSMVLTMARESMPVHPKVLELLDREKKGEVDALDVENMLELAESDDLQDESDSEDASPAMLTEESDDTPTLDDLLGIAYERAFNRDQVFYAMAIQLYKRSLTQARQPTDGKTQGNIKWINDIDQRMTAALEHAWRHDIAPGIWPLDGINARLAAIDVSSQTNKPFWVNGYVPQIGAYIILGGAEFYAGASYNSIPSAAAIYTKRKVLAGISDKPLLWIDTLEQLLELKIQLSWLAAHAERRADKLTFKMIAPGDFKRKPITKCFHGMAQFVENLGLPVTATLSSAIASQQNKLGGDAVFMQATARFWPYFEAVLKERGICSFNQLFAHYSEDHPENFAAVPLHVLGAMRHLMVDEFQDVSPQIVKWIRGCQRELVRRDMAGSLTCVGDDWQSIYGWRGSSPDFFVQFKQHFPAAKHGKVILKENFRSSDYLIRCAESVLVGVPGMEPKTCVAEGKWADANLPVQIHGVKGELPFEAIGQYIGMEVARTEACEERPMLVLSRERRHLEKLKRVSRHDWGKAVRYMTFHGAKGLEAQSVVLLGDCHYTGSTPSKNFLYEKAGLGSYDDAQRAEARRLAYVGITRAMEKCRWFAVRKDNGAIASLPASRPYVTYATIDAKQANTV